jgi:hypothetical protein
MVGPSAAGKRNNGKTGNWRKRSLGHRDKELGEEQGKELAGRLLTNQEAAAGGRITLGQLLAWYEADVSAQKKGSQPREDRRRIELWTQVLGANSDPEKITKGQITRFERPRRQGRLQLPGRRLAANPSETTIGADIVFPGQRVELGRRREPAPEEPNPGRRRPSRGGRSPPTRCGCR